MSLIHQQLPMPHPPQRHLPHSKSGSSSSIASRPRRFSSSPSMLAHSHAHARTTNRAVREASAEALHAGGPHLVARNHGLW